MFMNYMDYTDDAAMFMFTRGQSTADGRVPGGCPGLVPERTGFRPGRHRGGVFAYRTAFACRPARA